MAGLLRIRYRTANNAHGHLRHVKTLFSQNIADFRQCVVLEYVKVNDAILLCLPLSRRFGVADPDSSGHRGIVLDNGDATTKEP